MLGLYTLKEENVCRGIKSRMKYCKMDFGTRRNDETYITNNQSLIKIAELMNMQ